MSKWLTAVIVLAGRAALAAQASPSAAPDGDPTQTSSASQPNTQYDGTWTGKTSQDLELGLVIERGLVTSFTSGWSAPGKRCFPVTQGGSTVYVDPVGSSFTRMWPGDDKPKISGKQVTVTEPTTSGGDTGGMPMFTLTGTFAPNGELSGKVVFTAMEPVSRAMGRGAERPCMTTAEATFKAVRKTDGQPKPKQ
ncbi:MAG: hypothetical protein ACREA0_07490 [bacterium]